jgi:transglutaminase-like putative cysteine protease
VYYSIQHQTKFRYSATISETTMELRLQPRTEWTQHCLSFDLQTTPRARLFHYRDHLGNLVHHFNVPASHNELDIVATALVEVQPFSTWPEEIGADQWDAIDDQVARDDYWEMLMPSHYAQSSPLLVELAAKLHVVRRDDPMTVLRQINRGIYEAFEYMPKATRVDSPIDDALREGKGVCQDFAHIMITLVRMLRIPCRYVSGYVAPGELEHQRAASGEASHAWVEVLLPDMGWVGFDPTNDRLVTDHHIRCAVGRDYLDVPPTKGLFRGIASEQMSVQVAVRTIDQPKKPDAAFAFPVVSDWEDMPQQNNESESGGKGPGLIDTIRRQQQQQQQQQ